MKIRRRKRSGCRVVLHFLDDRWTSAELCGAEATHEHEIYGTPCCAAHVKACAQKAGLTFEQDYYTLVGVGPTSRWRTIAPSQRAVACTASKR